MNLDVLKQYIRESNGDTDAIEYTLEWIEENTSDRTVRELVSLLFNARNGE